MFDLNDPTLTRVKKGRPETRADFGNDVPPDEPEHALDAPEMTQRHEMLVSLYRQELSRQAENRREMAIDQDYYDHIQWTEAEKARLAERGQAPLVYNVVAQSANWIIGSERRGRSDFKILPRGKEDATAAEKKTKLLKYLSDVNRTTFHRSRAFEDAVIVGQGVLEDAVDPDGDGEIIYSRYESWRNVLWDSASTELDLSDARYVFRTKWVDLDIAKSLFPDRADRIEAACVEGYVTSSDLTDDDGDEAMDAPEMERDNLYNLNAVGIHKRKRVRLIEAWYRVPAEVLKIRSGTFRGDVFDESDPNHVTEVEAGKAIVKPGRILQMRCAVFTTKDMLWEGPSPYRHNRFPFTFVWGYRRGRDGLPYGFIRGVRDIQDDINKRASKTLHILSSNKVVVDNDAVEDWDEFLDEVSQPDGVLRVKPNARVELNVDRDLAPAHMELFSRNISMIQQVGGVTDELLARSTNATSGVAIQRRQEQGSLATSKFFDNLLLAFQMQGELQLSLIEQFMTEERQFRITNERGTPEYEVINDGTPENDITRTKADFVVSQTDWRATMRQAAVDQLLELAQKMPPQVVMQILDLMVDAMDIPNREEIAKRIRAMTGMKDPDNSELTPEDMQREQAAQVQQQYQMELAGAELAEKKARALKTQAEATRIAAQTIGDKVTAANTAFAAASQAIAMPTTAAVADGILSESGWNSFDVSGTIPQTAVQSPQQAGLPAAMPTQTEPGV